MALIAVSITALILSFGILCVRRPDRAIELQKRFYQMINWRLEPISVQKELTNTRFMGFFLAAISLATLILIIVKTLRGQL